MFDDLQSELRRGKNQQYDGDGPAPPSNGSPDQSRAKMPRLTPPPQEAHADEYAKQVAKWTKEAEARERLSKEGVRERNRQVQ